MGCLRASQVWLAFPDINRKYVRPLKDRICCCLKSFRGGGESELEKGDENVATFAEGDVYEERGSVQLAERVSSFA
jgi:hypothetical protein